MKKLLYIGIIVLSLLVPVKRLDITKLQPVEAVAIYLQDASVVLGTDTGDVGIGVDVEQALQNLKENATKVIYLDTAKYLLVGEGMEQAAGQLRSYLKSNISVSTYSGGEICEEMEYLEAHQNAPKPKG